MKTESKNWRERFGRELENEIRGNAEWTQILRGESDENLDAGTLARREFSSLAGMIAEEFCEILLDSDADFVSREGPSPEGKSRKAICPSRETKNLNKKENFSHEGLFALSENPSGLGSSCEKKADAKIEIEFPRFFILVFWLAKTVLANLGDCILLDNDADCALIRAVKKCVPALPIILEDSLGGVPALFFERQLFEEKKIAEFLTAFPPKSPKKISEIQQKMIDGNACGISLSDEQKSAIAAILQSRITIVRGGPGTGKTTILFRALACLLAENPELRIALAAPTNKAAARIREALDEQLKSAAGTDFSPEILEKIAEISPQTIHKLLGIFPKRELHAIADFDVIVIDEFSMVAQDLLVNLIVSLELAGTEILAGTRLILLGDENQLEAVQGGRVLAELAALAASRERENALRERGVALPILRESRRFSNEKFVGKLAGTVLRGDVAGAENLLAGTAGNCHTDLNLGNGDTLVAVSKICQKVELNSGDKSVAVPETLTTSLSLMEIRANARPKISEILRKILPAELQNPAGKSPEELLAAAEDFRIVTPQHKSDFGDENLNAVCANICGNGFSRERGNAGTEFFHGQMILLTERDETNRLEKGEIGVICREGNGEFFAYFRGNGGLRKVKISLLAAWQLGYAMTIHKSQGSEFSRLAVMIPPRGNENLLSRALLYTALTRFKERGNAEFSLIFARESLRACVENKRESVSCLGRRIARGL